MLKDYIEQCGATCVVKRNDEPDITQVALRSDAVVISPGPKTPLDAGALMPFLQNVIEHKPILGVCLGHQAIGQLYGATLTQAKLPKHGKVEAITQFGNEIFNGISERFEATRYHSLILKDLPDTLEITAVSDDGEVMGIAHKQLPVWGIQFHPESCTTVHGIKIIKNFLGLTHLSL